MVLNTLFIQAREAAPLALEATAFVTAREDLGTTFVHKIDAGRLATDIGESSLVGQ